ncbi:MAG: GNAT family N-acetyltransferase [Acidiferrobacterales bacterium]|nr:GNAT family N-acetyltransferase [Acidiferrobacterales bacterium]
MNKALIIRRATEEDFDAWSRLYDGYASFYKVHMDDEIKNRLWNWVQDDHHVINCFLAVDTSEASVVGFAHVRAMPSPLRGAEVGFLDDLFVDPHFRGGGAAQALFDRLEQHAKEQGWPLIRWITADDNYRARNLYDKLSNKTMWNTYQMDIT